MSELSELEKRIVEEFPEDQGKIRSLFQKRDFLNLLNFLERNKSFGIDSGKAMFALQEGNTKGLFDLAKRNVAKEERVEKLFIECAQLWGKQIGAFH